MQVVYTSEGMDWIIDWLSLYTLNGKEVQWLR